MTLGTERLILTMLVITERYRVLLSSFLESIQIKTMEWPCQLMREKSSAIVPCNILHRPYRPKMKHFKPLFNLTLIS